MTPTHFALLGFVAWTLTLLMCIGITRVGLVVAGKRSSGSFKPDGDDFTGIGKRLTRAQANCYENLPAAGALMLYAITTGQTGVTDGLAYVFLGARLLQSLAHLISTSRLFITIRLVFFVTQVLIMFSWLLKFLNTL